MLPCRSLCVAIQNNPTLNASLWMVIQNNPAPRASLCMLMQNNPTLSQSEQLHSVCQDSTTLSRWTELSHHYEYDINVHYAEVPAPDRASRATGRAGRSAHRGRYPLMMERRTAEDLPPLPERSTPAPSPPLQLPASPRKQPRQ